ncbi:hypothetical protein B0T19DRAFT_6480 [Cercophora scortea]|uniref:Uncharacterized protein n=1 Tax=Cercophora scortea TaxID=314031 RepID=A0AAE0J2L7_9PEZI|nr:hypothetical protein B0T19DRAFT_6480 [Cercophora scortea]
MLSRSGFSIRRLISNRKPASFEDEGDAYFIQDEIDTLKASFKESRIISWRTPMGLRKGTRQSGLDFDIRRTEDIHKITVKIPALPGTPSSSTSSLCSCEHHIDHTSPRSSPRQANDRSPQRSPLLCPTQLEDASHLKSRSPSPQTLDENPHLQPLVSTPEHVELAQEPKTDLPKPVSPSLEDANAVSIQVRTVGNEPPELLGKGGVDSFSEDIQQLIRETDEAFKPRHSFSEAPFSSSLFQEIAEVDHAQDVKPATPAPLMRSKSQRSQSSARTPTKPHVLLATPTRFPSISKTKRTRSKKSRRRSRANLGQSSGWTLPESARDLFTIRLFQRIEVNETLPESTLQEIRMSRACQSPPERHIEAMEKRDETARSDTPVETSHSGDLTSHNSDAIANLAVTPTMEAVDTPQSLAYNQEEEATQVDSTTTIEMPQTTHEEQQKPSVVSNEVEEKESTLPIMLVVEEEPPGKSKSIAVPAVPVRHQPRRLPSRQMLVPPLPTIPEVIATGPEQAIPSPTSVLPPPWATTKINEDDYIFLQSTPYTLTMPTFRHGPIRLTKADMSIGKLASAVDDTLDWTAFQMAILGGAGDFFSEPTDYSRPSDAELKELDDYIAWFDSFGFDGSGKLAVTADSKPRGRSPPSSTPSPSSSKSSSPRSTGRASPRPRRPDMHSRRQSPRTRRASPGATRLDDTPIPAPARTEPPEGPYHCADVGMHPLAPRPQPIDKKGMANSNTASNRKSTAAKNHVGLEIDSTRRPSNESTQSMPQSPMLDLVVSHDVEGNEYIVPMGFNLGHDLGDFLKWEAEHVFGGYYGPDP